MEIVKSWYNYSLRDYSYKHWNRDSGHPQGAKSFDKRREAYTLIQHIPYQVIQQNIEGPLQSAIEESEKRIKVLTG